LHRSWNTHVFRSSDVRVTGVKLFSGADGFDPDCSQDVVIDSVFVHSNDDAFAVKARQTAVTRNANRVGVFLNYSVGLSILRAHGRGCIVRADKQTKSNWPPLTGCWT